nr:hypothetical protein [Tanacetum cinerariifolium]
MNQNPQIDDNLTFCPSFNCYTTSSSAAAAINISNSLLPDHDNEFNFVIEEDDNHLSPTVYPLFNQNCDTLQSLFITERQDDQQPDTSSSDDEEDEGNENGRGAVFCVWKGKSDTSSSSVSLTKCKKSRSTGSGSKRWRIRDLLRRSNSEGKEPAIMLVSHNNNYNNNKKVVEKVKRNPSVEGNSVINGRSKPSVHEIFYVQNRAKTQDGKRRSYLPYRQGLVGFFTNVNGKGKSFPF